jgi:hypothetical protein
MRQNMGEVFKLLSKTRSNKVCPIIISLLGKATAKAIEAWADPLLLLDLHCQAYILQTKAALRQHDRPDDEYSNHLGNVGKLLPDYTVQQPRRQSS